MSEAGLGERMTASAVTTLRVLFTEHHDGLVRLAGLLTRDQGAAEEVVQEAFVRLHGALHRLRDPDAALPYLRRTVVNLSRSRGRRILVASRYQPARQPDVEGADVGALRLLGNAEIVDAVSQLSRRQRECVVLRFYEDMSESETAGVLGVSRNSVKKHMQRAMASLAALLQEDR